MVSYIGQFDRNLTNAATPETLVMNVGRSARGKAALPAHDDHHRKGLDFLSNAGKASRLETFFKVRRRCITSPALERLTVVWRPCRSVQ